MSTDTTLATVQAPTLAAYEPRSLDEASRLATLLHASGLAPRALGKPEAILYALIAGRELGLTSTQALRSLHIIDGRVTLSADLIVAQVRRSPACRYWQLVESTSERCTLETHREGDPQPTRLSYTIDDAKAAGLVGKDNWRRHPAAMLRARCATALARAVYPDTALGLYDPDEGEEIARGQVPQREPIRAEVLPRVDPRPEEPPAASDTWDAWLSELAAAETLPDVRAAYGALADQLRAAGEDPAERLSEASRAVTERVAALGYRVAAAELREMLQPSLAGGRLAAYAELIHALEPTATNAAHWWRSQRASIPAEHADTVKRLLARKIATTPDAAGTRAAGAALRAALLALDTPPQPPPRGGAPVPVAPESTTASATCEPGDESEAEAALAGWETTAEGREAHAATLAHPRAVLASARRHCTLPGYARVLAARLVALGGTDAQGTTLSEESALAQVNGAMAQAQRDRRAARDAAARRAA